MKDGSWVVNRVSEVDVGGKSRVGYSSLAAGETFGKGKERSYHRVGMSFKRKGGCST